MDSYNTLTYRGKVFSNGILLFYLFTFSAVCGTTSISKSSAQDTDMKEIQEPSLVDINKGMFTLKSY